MFKNKLSMDTVVGQRCDIDVTDIDGEKAMMDINKGRYFVLNNVSSSIWDIISKPCSIKEIIMRLMEEYDVEATTCEQCTLEFLGRLKDAELITIH
jgi:recombinational DNA repair protein RecR